MLTPLCALLAAITGLAALVAIYLTSVLYHTGSPGAVKAAATPILVVIALSVTALIPLFIVRSWSAGASQAIEIDISYAKKQG